MKALLHRAWDQFKRQGKLGKVITLLVIASLPICYWGGSARPVGTPSRPAPVTQATGATATVLDSSAAETAIASAIFARLTAEALTVTPTALPTPSLSLTPFSLTDPSVTPAPKASELTCAVLQGADLSDGNPQGAAVTAQQLEQAAELTGADVPDGTVDRRELRQWSIQNR